MTKKIRTSSLALSLMLGLAATSQVSAEKIKGDAMCEKIKSCALESLEGQEVPEQVKEMLMSKLDSQCATAFKSKEEEILNAGLADEANSCADSMVALPCDKLLTPDGAQKTEACEAFNTAATEAGIDVN